jgi:copper chaperone CopZ
MKTIKFLAAVVLLTVFSTNLKAEFIRAEVQVSGLTCSMCQLATEKSLKTLDFISEIKPDLNKNVYIVTFKKGKAVNLDLIKKKVKDAGFSVSKLVAVFDFDNVKVTNAYTYKFGGNNYYFMNVPAKTLNGITRLTILDKDFVPAADYKKMAASNKAPSYKTGQTGTVRTYHVTI